MVTVAATIKLYSIWCARFFSKDRFIFVGFCGERLSFRSKKAFIIHLIHIKYTFWLCESFFFSSLISIWNRELRSESITINFPFFLIFFFFCGVRMKTRYGKKTHQSKMIMLNRKIETNTNHTKQWYMVGRKTGNWPHDIEFWIFRFGLISIDRLRSWIVEILYVHMYTWQNPRAVQRTMFMLLDTCGQIPIRSRTNDLIKELFHDWHKILIFSHFSRNFTLP